MITYTTVALPPTGIAFDRIVAFQTTCSTVAKQKGSIIMSTTPYPPIALPRPFGTSAPASITSRCVFDLPVKDKEIAKLTEETQQPGFWDDSRAAQAIMRRITALQEQVDQWRGFSKRASELGELLAAGRRGELTRAS